MFLAPYTLLRAPFKFPTTLDTFYASVPTPSLLIYSPQFPPSSFFQAFTPSIGGRRRWEEDVEESGFSFARSRLTPTPKWERRTESIASVSALRGDSLVSPSQCLSLPSPSVQTPCEASLLVETHCGRTRARTVISNLCFQRLEGLCWNR